MAGKKEEVSLFYVFLCLVIIVGVGYLAVSAFTGKLGTGNRPASSTTEGEITLTLTDDKATELLRGSLPENVPLNDLEVKFQSGRIVIGGKADVDGILTSAVTESYPDLGAIKSLLPSNVSFSASFTVSVVGEGVNAEPNEFYLSGYRIPVAFLPSSIKKSLNGAINAAVGNTGLKITGISVGDGRATISAK